MAERTTRKDLDQLALLINRRAYPDRDHVYFIQYAYGRPRLVRDGGSVDVSPRLPSGQLKLWMQAFLAGMEARR